MTQTGYMVGQYMQGQICVLEDVDSEDGGETIEVTFTSNRDKGILFETEEEVNKAQIYLDLMGVDVKVFEAEYELKEEE